MKAYIERLVTAKVRMVALLWRLVDTNLVLGERIGPEPGLQPHDRFRLVEKLEGCRSLHDQQARRVVVNCLPQAIRVRIESAAKTRIHLCNIVDTCAGFSSGLTDLVAAVRWVEGDTRALRSAVAFLASVGVACE